MADSHEESSDEGVIYRTGPMRFKVVPPVRFPQQADDLQSAVAFAKWEERLAFDSLDDVTLLDWLAAGESADDAVATPGRQTGLQPFALQRNVAHSVIRFQSPAVGATQGPVAVAPPQESADCGPMQPQGPPANTSWMYRPVSIGLACGVLTSGTLIDDWVSQGTGSFGAIRLGIDLDDRWGLELRYGFGSTPLYDSARAIAARNLVDTNLGVPQTSELRYDYSKRRNCDQTVLDLSVLLYPGGDARWRPYFLVGLGVAQVRFVDALRERYSRTVGDMPLAIGIKYLVAERLALRLEACDTVVFSGGAGFNALNDLTVTGGIELRLGGNRRSYWPWVPGDHAW